MTSDLGTQNWTLTAGNAQGEVIEVRYNRVPRRITYRLLGNFSLMPALSAPEDGNALRVMPAAGL